MHFPIFSYVRYFCHTLLSFATSFILLFGYYKKFPLELGGGSQIGKSAYAMVGGRSKRTCAYNGRGSIFYHFVYHDLSGCVWNMPRYLFILDRPCLSISSDWDILIFPSKIPSSMLNHNPLHCCFISSTLYPSFTLTLSALLV